MFFFILKNIKRIYGSPKMDIRQVTLPFKDILFDVKKTQSFPEYFETYMSNLPVRHLLSFKTNDQSCQNHLLIRLSCGEKKSVK